jgi:YHS domain-containing protein
MNSLSRVLRYLFWVLVVSWSVALLRRFVAWMLRNAAEQAQASANAAAAAGGNDGSAQNTPSARRLVRDPVCGMHVAEELAVPLRDGGELVHFCSTACRDQYAKSMQRMAANG